MLEDTLPSLPALFGNPLLRGELQEIVAPGPIDWLPLANFGADPRPRISATSLAYFQGLAAQSVSKRSAASAAAIRPISQCQRH